MTNLEFLEKFNLRTTCIKATECVEKTDYTINLMIAHPEWTYLQETYLQEKLGLEKYFQEFPDSRPIEDRVDEIWHEERPIKVNDSVYLEER